jgi:predicted  nucleic acid-binding Zn-ribbon protein
MMSSGETLDEELEELRRALEAIMADRNATTERVESLEKRLLNLEKVVIELSNDLRA